MRSHRIIGTTLFVLALTTLNALPARSAVSSLNLPLTPREQAERLWMLTKPETANRLFPSTNARFYPYIQRAYRNAPQYVKKFPSEKAGEQGAARFAAKHGWIKLLGATDKFFPQGPDSVYWDHQSGLVRVLEAKGGTATPNFFFDSRQGTNQHSIRSAEGVLKSSKAPRLEKMAAAQTIVAAQERRLVTGVVSTLLDDGKPLPPKLTHSWSRADVSSEALDIERRLIRKDTHLQGIFRQARRAQSIAMFTYRAAPGVAILGVAGLGWDAYQQFSVGRQMLKDPALDGDPLPNLQAGIALGRAGQLTTLGASSYATFMRLPTTGWVRAAGTTFLPLSFGVEGMLLAKAYYEYHLGRVSRRDFYRRATAVAIVPTFSASGAIVGGAVGLYAVGVGALPGAAAGAKFGFIVAIPFQYAADYLWEWYYRDFDTRQLQLVNATIEEFYGFDSASDADPR